jgi:hypothetical protein
MVMGLYSSETVWCLHYADGWFYVDPGFIFTCFKIKCSAQLGNIFENGLLNKITYELGPLVCAMITLMMNIPDGDIGQFRLCAKMSWPPISMG